MQNKQMTSDNRLQALITLAQSPGPDLAYNFNRLIRAHSALYSQESDLSASRQGGLIYWLTRLIRARTGL